jgi:hypothetical protein
MRFFDADIKQLSPITAISPPLTAPSASFRMRSMRNLISSRSGETSQEQKKNIIFVAI